MLVKNISFLYCETLETQILLCRFCTKLMCKLITEVYSHTQYFQSYFDCYWPYVIHCTVMHWAFSFNYETYRLEPFSRLLQGHIFQWVKYDHIFPVVDNFYGLWISENIDDIWLKYITVKSFRMIRL